MANRLFSPNLQFSNSAGLPFAGGTLSFFASGTATPLGVFSDKALTISRGTVVTLDSAGQGGDIFLQNLAYKVVLADVNANQIWTADPVYASDFSTVAQVTGTNGSPNGQLAGTAASASIPASLAWDFVNNILYVCTTTGTSSTAVWTAVNASSAAAVVPAPQGYLTPTSQTPIIPGDVISATSLFYTPYVGNLVPLFNGASFVPTTFSELTLTLASQHLANTIYDVFVFSNTGVVTIATGPAWSNSGAGTGVRGTGAGTTQLNRINGLLVNATQITGARNGASTFTIGANLGTYIGSIYIDSVAAQVTFHRTNGPSRKWSTSNAYNRTSITLQVTDPAASWSYTTGTFRPSNNNTANNCIAFTGLAEELVAVAFDQTIKIAFAQTAIPQDSGLQTANNGIGLNSTTATTAKRGGIQQEYSSSGSGVTASVTTASDATARMFLLPTLGINQFTCLESGSLPSVGTGGSTFFGTNANMLMTASWRG